MDSLFMNMAHFDLYLASASPRRKALLESIGLKLLVCPADIDEEAYSNETPESYVRRLALQKAQAAFERCQDRILHRPFMGADTIVTCDGELFGKPLNEDDAVRMWTAMSGKKHQVLTALAVIDGVENDATSVVELSISHVQFKALHLSEMRTYWMSGEPQDKAGAYGIQGAASAWVQSIQGSYTGIMGLPLFETNRALSQFNLNWL